MPTWIDVLLSGVCHQIPANALTHGDRLSPLCARCTGLFAGALLVVTVLVLSRCRRAGLAPWWAQGVLAALAMWWALDGLNSVTHGILGRPLLYEPTNVLRLFTGLGMGLAIGLTLWPLAVQALAATPDRSPAIERPRLLLGLLAVMGAAGVLLRCEALPWQIAAVWSVAGVALVLGATNWLLVVVLTGIPPSLLRGARLALSLVAGVVLATLEVGSLALLRRLVGV